MTLTVRSASVTGATTAARALTHAEMDANWAHVIESSNQNFTPSGSGAVASSVQDIIRRFSVNVFNFIPLAEWSAIIAGTSTTDVSSYIQAALDAHPGRWIYFPNGTYVISTALTIDDGDGTILIGEGVKSIIKKVGNIDMVNLGKLGQIDKMCLEGQGATYTGRGVVVAGAAGAGGDETSWVRITDSSIINMASHCVEFTQERAGYASHLTNVRMTLAGADAYTKAVVKMPDTEANNGNRYMIGCWSYGHILFDAAGCDNLIVQGCQGAVPIFTSSSKKVSLTGSRIVGTGNGSNNDLDVTGEQHSLTGNVFAPIDFSFDSNCAAVTFSGNAIASGSTWSDTSTGVTDGNQIYIPQQQYTPTWTTSGTAPAIGDGTLNGAWRREGELVHVNIRFEAGSTTTFGTGLFEFSLPYTASRRSVGQAYIEDASGVAVYVGSVYIANGQSTCRLVSSGSTSAYVGAASPMAWDESDKIWLDVTYAIQ
jgi:hypothetical protein